MLTLIVLASLVAAPLGARVAFGRLDPRQQREVRVAWSRLRIRSGSRDLRGMVEILVHEAHARSLRSFSRTYVPNDLRFGLAPADYAHLQGLVAHVEDEVADVIAREVAQSEGMALGGALRVLIVEDDAASVGRPRVAARIGAVDAVHAQHAASPFAVRRTAGATGVTEVTTRPYRPDEVPTAVAG